MDYHFFWKKIKGCPITLANCDNCVLSCYNCLVQNLMENSGSISEIDLNWCNKQVYVCFEKVLATLTGKPSIKHACVDVSCNDVISITNLLLLQLHKNWSEKLEILQQAIQRVAVICSFTWLLHLPQAKVTCVQNLIDTGKISWKNNMFPGASFIDVLIKQELSSVKLMSSQNISINTIELLYLEACRLYGKGKHDSVVQLVSAHLKGNGVLTSPKLLLLYNVLACSHVRLNQTLIAVTLLRKAIDHEAGEQFLHLIMYNLIQTFVLSDKISAGIKTAEMLLSINDSYISNTFAETPSFVFHVLQGQAPVSSNCISTTKMPKRYFSQNIEMQYKIAKLHLLIRNNDAASVWFGEVQRTLTSANTEAIPRTDEFPLCFPLPTMQQIQAEEHYVQAAQSGFVTAFNFDENDWNYCVACFKKMKKVGWERKESDVSISKNFEENNIIATRLLYCFCNKIYAMEAMLSCNLQKYRKIALACLQQLECILPFSKKNNTNDTKYTPSGKFQETMAALSSLKAKVYFNCALACCAGGDNAQPNDVLKLLQSALEFDLCNVTMRWNATLLLWRLGEKEEALKTWCKTRGIDYRLNTQELLQTMNEKELMLHEVTASAKKDLLAKDLAIMKELENVRRSYPV